MFTKSFLIEAKNKFMSRANRLFPAALSFYMTLTLIGGSSLAVIIAAIMGYELEFFEVILGFILPASSEFLSGYFDSLDASGVGSNLLALVVTTTPLIWMISHGYMTMSIITREQYGLPETITLKRRFKSMGLSLALMILLLTGIGFAAVMLTQWLVIGKSFVIFVTIIGIGLSIFAGSLFILWFPVRKHIKVKMTIPGAILTTLGIIIIILASYFLTWIFRGYDELYGQMASILILLITLSYMSKTINYGISYNVVYFNSKYKVEKIKGIKRVIAKFTTKK